jgi:hypothetical protein
VGKLLLKMQLPKAGMWRNTSHGELKKKTGNTFKVTDAHS